MPNEQLLARLQERFPLTWHRDRKLPGGGNYLYVPWKRYVERLDQLCGLNWSEEYSDPVICGDYLSVRCRLTIDGTTREGIGSIRVYPETNDQGRAKIIGDPPNNAYRGAFTDACYKFGLGRYLDDQATVREWWESSQPGTRVKQEMKRLRMAWSAVVELIKDSGLPRLEEMTDDECDRLIALMQAKVTLSRS